MELLEGVKEGLDLPSLSKDPVMVWWRPGSASIASCAHSRLEGSSPSSRSYSHNVNDVLSYNIRDFAEVHTVLRSIASKATRHGPVLAWVGFEVLT